MWAIYPNNLTTGIKLMSENPDSNIPLDFNKIFTDLAEKLIVNTASSAYNKGKGFLKGKSDDVRLKLETYKDYLAYVHAHYSKAKSFLIRDESTQLYDFYVPMGISCGKKISEEASIFNFTVKNGFAVIQGTAGSGKSMMMRHLFLNTIEKQERVPIFIELRKINDFDGTLFEFIKEILSENKFTLDSEYIEKALKAGHFAIFLDGFDEIALSKRTQLIKETKKLAKDFDKNIIIISSRPDDEFASWTQFDNWTISPLTLLQALKLVRKIPSQNINKETRDNFLEDLETSLYKKNQSFLSNPLLLSIMVITYASSGDVPDRISTFYENAYIALFERHDILKGAFKRDKRCNLDISDFKKIFSAFSALSANVRFNRERKNSLRFPKTAALKFIKKAKEISIVSNDFNHEDFLEDCLRAVCLLLEDGLEITYAHRSFQEYFTAVFISELDDAEAQKEIISTYIQADDGTLMLLQQINPSILERLVLIPNLQKLEKEIEFEGSVTFKDFHKFMEYCFNKEKPFLVRSPISNTFSFSGVLSDNPEGRLMAWIYKYIFETYKPKRMRASFTLSEASVNEIQKLVELRLDNEKILEIPFFLNPELEQVYFKDKSMMFSERGLDALFTLKNQLEEKYKKIDAARKANLFNSLNVRF
jgi:hypothetical protein